MKAGYPILGGIGRPPAGRGRKGHSSRSSYWGGVYCLFLEGGNYIVVCSN